MDKEFDVSRRLAEYLVQHGYPEDSIVLEWKISDKHHVDLAVIDNISKKAVALFECKRQKQKTSEFAAIAQLKRCAEIIGDKTIPLYSAFGANNADGFEVYFLGEEDGKEVLKLIPSAPQFTNLKNSSLSKSVSKIERDKQTSFNGFKCVCWLFAGLIGLALCLDFTGCILITPERLGVVAIIIGLVVVPFAKKLSILGLEFERQQESDLNSNKKN